MQRPPKNWPFNAGISNSNPIKGRLNFKNVPWAGHWRTNCSAGRSSKLKAQTATYLVKYDFISLFTCNIFTKTAWNTNFLITHNLNFLRGQHDVWTPLASRVFNTPALTDLVWDSLWNYVKCLHAWVSHKICSMPSHFKTVFEYLEMWNTYSEVS